MTNSIRAMILGSGYAGEGHTLALQRAGVDVNASSAALLTTRYKLCTTMLAFAKSFPVQQTGKTVVIPQHKGNKRVGCPISRQISEHGATYPSIPSPYYQYFIYNYLFF